MFKINDDVKYTYKKKGIIEQIHYDDAPDIYYTLKINSKKIIFLKQQKII